MSSPLLHPTSADWPFCFTHPYDGSATVGHPQTENKKFHSFGIYAWWLGHFMTTLWDLSQFPLLWFQMGGGDIRNHKYQVTSLHLQCIIESVSLSDSATSDLGKAILPGCLPPASCWVTLSHVWREDLVSTVSALLSSASPTNNIILVSTGMTKDVFIIWLGLV